MTPSKAQAAPTDPALQCWHALRDAARNQLLVNGLPLTDDEAREIIRRHMGDEKTKEPTESEEMEMLFKAGTILNKTAERQQGKSEE